MNPSPTKQADTASDQKSPNFQFLNAHHPLLVRYAAYAERYLFEDPNTALIKLRQFAELLAQKVCANVGIDFPPDAELSSLLVLLRDQGVVTGDTLDLFHGLRRAGNAAVHGGAGIFDAVNLYAALLPHSEMRPVVTRPRITFREIAAELNTLTDADARAEVYDQLLAKLRAKRRVLESNEINVEACERLTGMAPHEFVTHMASLSPEQARDWFQAHPNVPELLDIAKLEPERVLISSHADQLIRQEHGYGERGQRPADYLESFRAFVSENRDTLAALKIVTQRPRELTRQALKDLKIALQEAGFSETHLQTAWRDTRNEDIAATIIGYVRHVMTGEALRPYKERVAAAMRTILASRAWTPPQRKWLERIGKQLETETVVDRQAFDQGQFQAEGGFNRLNRVFNGELEAILGQIAETIWPVAA